MRKENGNVQCSSAQGDHIPLRTLGRWLGRQGRDTWCSSMRGQFHMWQSWPAPKASHGATVEELSSQRVSSFLASEEQSGKGPSPEMLRKEQ